MRGWVGEGNMPIWVLDVVSAFALAIVESYGFLVLRFRTVGRPFGPRARWWAVTIILVTAAMSAGFGLAIAAVVHDSRAVYAGLVVPCGLWLGQTTESGPDRGPLARPLTGWATFLLQRLYDRMGDDMQEWCDARLSWASRSPLGLTDAVDYYYGQVSARLADERPRVPLDRWRESITHKISVVRLIRLESTSDRVRGALRSQPLSGGLATYVAGDPGLLAERLESDAKSELGLFLAYLYRLGYRDLAAFPAKATLSPRPDSPPDRAPRRAAAAAAAGAGRLLPKASIGFSVGAGALLVSGVGTGLEPIALIFASALLGTPFVRGRKRDARRSGAVPPPGGGSVDAQLISFWITERQAADQRPLAVGTGYTGVFRVGAPVAGNLAEGERTIPLSDIPPPGLETDWVVWSTTVRLEAAPGQDPALVETTVSDAGDQEQWMARFQLLIPRQGDSEERRLRLVPVTAGAARIDAVVLVGKDIYRRVSVSLAAREQSSPVEQGPAQPTAAVVDVTQVRAMPLRHTGLIPCRKWQTPDYSLDLGLLPPHVIVKSSAGLSNHVNWVPKPTVSQLIESVRSSLDVFRAVHSGYLDAIEPDDLASRLRYSTPAPDWQSSPEPADDRFRLKWQQVAISDELRWLAYQGNRLYDAVFPVGTKLRELVDRLNPGDRLNITWFSESEPLISHMPWALMYRQAPPGRGEVTDPDEFLGMRLRIAYTSHPLSEYTRALGPLAQTTRGHIFYWGETASDPTAIEAARHKQELAVWAPLVLPSGESLRKHEVSTFLSAPAPSPVSVLYLYCRCSSGTGTDPVLQFGSTNAADDLIELIDIGRGKLDDQPLAFLNGCDTVSAAPFFSNMLEDVFLERGCRAFIGTEAKVPAGLAARFATTFFSFLYRDSECPVSAGEAFAQARNFLWDQYRNLGGLLYSYVNDYDLFAANDERVAELRRVS
jgi:hypothetical protein